MPEILHYKGVLYPVGEEPEELRDGGWCMALTNSKTFMLDRCDENGWFSYITHVGPIPEPQEPNP